MPPTAYLLSEYSNKSVTVSAKFLVELSVHFPTFDQLRHLHIGPTSVAQMQDVYVLAGSAKKARLNPSQTQNILENMFPKGESRTACRISQKPRKEQYFLTVFDSPLEYIQVLPIPFSGQVNIEVTVGKQVWIF